MRRMIALLVGALLLVTLCSCRKTKEDLKFYVVSGSEVTASMGDDAILAAAKKKGRVAFTGADIKGYLWASHRVQLQNVNALGGTRDGGSAFFQADPEDLFVLALGGKVLYVGGFAAGSSTVNPPRNPYIKDESSMVFSIIYDSKFGQGEDPRGNTVLYNYLTDQQLLVSKIQ